MLPIVRARWSFPLGSSKAEIVKSPNLVGNSDSETNLQLFNVLGLRKNYADYNTSK